MFLNIRKSLPLVVLSLILLFVAGIGKTYISSKKNNLKVTENKPLLEKISSRTLAQKTYAADIKTGVIGSNKPEIPDDAFDNIFHIYLPTKPVSTDRITLSYSVKGVAGESSVARSINTSFSKGGYFIRLNDNWTKQKEYLSNSVLHQGDNIIVFHATQNIVYKITDVKLQVEKVSRKPAININQSVSANGKIYISGVLNLPGKLFYDKEPVKVSNGEFEFIIPDNKLKFTIQAILTNGNIVTKQINTNHQTPVELRSVLQELGTSSAKEVIQDKSLTLQINSEHFVSKVLFPKNTLFPISIVTIAALRPVDVPPLSNDIINVTGGAASYRLITGLSLFKKKVKLFLSYNSQKIPEGYTAKDIRTFYFDTRLRQWIAVSADSVDTQAGTVNSFIDHGSDLINGIIKVPESPQTQGYTPTSIKDYKTADPANGVVIIDAPKANSMGTASLSFPLKLLKGRLGLQPNLAIQYNSDAGNGWLGLGWNIAVPSIGTDTRWGVPRYDSRLETETYQLAGEQLAPVANRTALVARVSNRQFQQRIEGAFKKIIRHGASPKAYWWEVIDKNGLRSFYGGTPENGVVNEAVLKDRDENIGQWQLVETRDLHDNGISYQYKTVWDPGIANGTISGTQIYLSRINYTEYKNAAGYYQIDFIRSSENAGERRRDVEINARLGFKMVTADRLETIRIKTKNGELIRSYALKYDYGEFSKSLLKSVSEIDKDGLVFYKHDFDYFNDIKSNGGAVLAPVETWNVPFDNIKGNFKNPLASVSDEGSLLNTVKSNGSEVGLALTIGFGTFGDDKLLTMGGSVGSGSGESEGLSSLVDINGDGLPDKVFKQNGGMYFRPGQADHSFGDAAPVVGIGDFSYSKSKTNKKGVQIIPPFSFLGYENSTTTTKTSVYFSDFNGDGLVDIAANGQVYFNHVVNGSPVFEPASTHTPNPILPINFVDQSLFGPDNSLKTEHEKQYPLQDAVRFWQAPFSGTIKIEGNVQLLAPLVGGVVDHKQDGVNVIIDTNNKRITNLRINRGDFSVKTITVNSLSVKAGQKIFFRVHSVYNGDGDKVHWDPQITYLSPFISRSDANNRFSGSYKASEDFILDNAEGIKMPKTGTVNIDGIFKKSITSDGVSLLIIQTRNAVADTIYRQDFAYGQIENISVSKKSVAVNENDILNFVIHSDSHIDKTKTDWFPHFQYSTLADGASANDLNDAPIFEGYVVPDKANYNDCRLVGETFLPDITTAITVSPKLSVSGSGSGSIIFTVKGHNMLLAKKIINVSGGTITNLGDVTFNGNAGDPYFFDFATNSQTFAISNTKAGLSYAGKNTEIIAGNYTDFPIKYLGRLYRGWGQFSFKGDQPDVPLNSSQLNLNEYNNYPTDAGSTKYNDPAELAKLPDPTLSNFVPMHADFSSRAWVGLDSSVYVSADAVSSSRLFMHDVEPDSLMQGSSLISVNKVRVSKVKTFAVSGGIPLLSVSLSRSTATTTTELDMMDMNGDRYPDVLNQDNIQYTQPNGSLDANVGVPHGMGGTKSKGESEGAGLGGHYTPAKSDNITIDNSFSEQAIASASIGLSGNIGKNDEQSNNTWLDINGDGLPDKIFDDGTVALNLGYRFEIPENWGIAAIDKNKTKTAGGGLSISDAIGSRLGSNIVSGSFEAGISLSRSTTTGINTLSDVNGDGLADQVSDDGVQLNTGSGFSPKINWGGLAAFSNNISTGESANAAFTIAISPGFIPIKICINPSYSRQHGVSREKDQITDIDGDGFPDILHSENDGDLKVERSLIGRTNLLSMVHRPMGGSFKVTYKRTDNSYDLPQNRWILDKVTLFDGVAGDGVDSSQTQFTYKNGYYDRREREFFGFATVQTDELNTGSKNEVYRSIIEEFYNDKYYKKGLLTRQWLQDANGNKFTETTNVYDLRIVSTDVQFPAITETYQFIYEGQKNFGAMTYTVFDYDAYGNITKINDAGDNSAQDLFTAEITYHDNAGRYIKNIPKSILVRTVDGEKRKRTTQINEIGEITEIDQFLADGSKAAHNMKYDPYGNLSQITRPLNDSSQRFYYKYEYDPIVSTYVSKVSDGYGYSSTSEYEYLFGNTLKTISLNNEPMAFTVDSRGRIKTITGPYEIAADKPYTIAFDYFPQAAIPYALSRHYDPEHGGDINIVTFIDGLGRSIQIKKKISLFAGKKIGDKVQMVVSGKTLFDAFGRTLKSYYPTTENISGNNTTYNTNFGILNTTGTYDIQDRPLKQTLADGATTSFAYKADAGLMTETITDALHNVTETVTDIRERKRENRLLSGPFGPIVTKFDYNGLSELIAVTDNSNNITSYTYDNLGRRISAKYPDAGETIFTYDLAGNLTKKSTPQIRKDFPKDGGIKYQYQFERLTGIDYPTHYENKVTYKYGSPEMGDRAARLILQEDASGGLEFYYGKLGEVTKQIRTVLVNKALFKTFVSEQSYDTWNRLKTMTYADGEVLTYHYNPGGSLQSVDGQKLGNVYKYVDQLGYDKFEQRVYLRYGNGTETQYGYDSLRRRLITLAAATAAGRLMMDNTYGYDAVSNILNVTNRAKLERGKLGGNIEQNYKYDNLYRLVNASGKYRGVKDSASYALTMQYDNLYNIVRKTMVNPMVRQSYEHQYTYGGTPHQATKIGPANYTFDLNGNNLGSQIQKNFWDEENRLSGVYNNTLLSQYTYDANGERIIKSSGGLKGNWVNGSPAGTINHYDDYTLYVSPYLVYTRSKFTKHFYIENQRISSKIGTGSFTNNSFPQSAVTAGGVNYIERAENLQRQRLEYYKSLNVSPGPPTDKFYYAEHPTSGMAPPIALDNTATNVPPGWPGNTTPPVNGPPVYISPIPSNDSVKAGFGFKGTGHLYEDNRYFYHPDHLGSTSYITNDLGEVSQHVEYSAFGETLVDERQGALNTPYLFNAKERDTETGYYYYGARYYDANASLWLSVDPMVDKYGGVSPYNYVLNTPVKFTDPDGRFIPLIIGAVELGMYAYGVYNAYEVYHNPNATKTDKALAYGGLALAPVASSARLLGGISKGISYLKKTAAVAKSLTAEAKITETAVAIEEVGLGQTISKDFTIVNGASRTLNDLNTLKGASWEEIEALIPASWQRGALNKGEGIKFINPAKKGEQILLEKGFPESKDLLHQGPYMKVSRNGIVERIPLKGNPSIKE